jgi:two-component system sensor histidine kinase DesK
VALVPGRPRPRLRLAFIAAMGFFTLSPLVSMLAHPPAGPALVLLLASWAIFAAVLASLFTRSPFGDASSPAWLAVASVTMTILATTAVVGWGAVDGAAVFFYAGVSAARIRPERLAVSLIAVAGAGAAIAMGLVADDPGGGLGLGVTVATISITLFALSALGRANRSLEAARNELAVLAVAEERSRIARDLHDTLGHSLSVIALKSELARRTVHDAPDRAASEMADVERVARDALTAVRETVSGYRQPSLAVELAGARSALAAAGIEGDVEPAPEGLARDVDALLGWAVREGVTNVLRHSDATRARVRVLTGGDRGAVEVVDDGRSPGRETGDTGGADGARGTVAPGSGIEGLRERAALLGGRVEAGPLPEGGFRLLVAVPMPAGGPGAGT